MTAITEDQVLSLMKGLRAREKRAMKRLEVSTGALPKQPSRATAQVLAFEGGEAHQAVKQLLPADVIPLAVKPKACFR